MSAYIVENDDINGIVAYLQNHINAVEILHGLNEIGFNLTDEPQKLAQAMLELNYDSVNQRYNEDDKAPSILYNPVYIDEIQAFKALRCFLYQSCEGDCMERPLYKRLDELSHYMETAAKSAIINQKEVDAEKTAVRRAENREDELSIKPHLIPAEKCTGGKHCAKNMRIELKKAFKSIKFSVRSDYSSVRVSWTDGPTVEEVEAIVDKYEEGSFNGMEDIYEYNSTPFNDVFGGVQYVFTGRSDSDKAIEKAIESISIEYQHELEGMEQPNLEDYKNGSLLRIDIPGLCEPLSRVINQQLSNSTAY